eukprot:UN26968
MNYEKFDSIKGHVFIDYIQRQFLTDMKEKGFTSDQVQRTKCLIKAVLPLELWTGQDVIHWLTTKNNNSDLLIIYHNRNSKDIKGEPREHEDVTDNLMTLSNDEFYHLNKMEYNTRRSIADVFQSFNSSGGLRQKHRLAIKVSNSNLNPSGLDKSYHSGITGEVFDQNGRR